MIKTNIAPGINRLSTKAEATGGYWDCNNIRFQYGKPESIMGWRQYDPSNELELNGIARKQHTWRDLNGRLYYMVGTEQKLYVVYKNIPYDITPIETVIPFTAVTFETVAPSTLIVECGANHDRSVGDWVSTRDIVVTSGAVGGVASAGWSNENGEGWRITTVPTATSFTVEVPFTVTTDGPLALTAGTIELQLRSSRYNIYNNGIGTGWGSGSWGSGPWGGAASTGYNISNAFRLWSVTNRGEDLIVSPTFGEIYIWSIEDSCDSTTGVPDPVIERRAVTLQAYALAHGGVVSVDVPVNNTYVLQSISDGRLVSFGCNQFTNNTTTTGDFTNMLIRWSDNDLNDKDIFDWGPRSTNTAGGQVLEKGTSFEAVIETSKEKLIWTDTALYSMTNIGPPSIYGFDLIGENISIASPMAAVSVGNDVYFMGDNAFYIYRGTVELLPSTVDNYVWDDINLDQIGKVYAVADESFSEITWHYCSYNSNEIDRYVVYNRSEQTWYYGRFDSTSIPRNIDPPEQVFDNTKNRTSWLNSGIIDKPLATYIKTFDTTVTPFDIKSSIFIHEEEFDGDGMPIYSYVESGDFVVGDLESAIFVNEIVPDVLFNGNSPDMAGEGITISMTSRRYPQSQVVNESSVEVIDSSGKLNVRSRGKVFNLKIEANTGSYQWKLGNIYLNGIADGKRP